MDDDQDQLDLAIALSLQQTFDNETNLEQKKYEKRQSEWGETSLDPKSIVDEHLELTDPNPNIHDLFVQYDAMFFWRTLVSSGVAVRWSPRMTLCAGLCVYEGRGGLCSIRLSQPLLKLRPRKDLVQTLLHEMIHAYLFVTENYRDHDGHGPKFLSHMHRINKMTGANITVYHSFHDEVREYRQHWWKCDGPCQFRPPYFGIVKRAMNRAPSPRDPWWSQHQKGCGGTYKKIKEPENYSKKREKQSKKKKNTDKLMNIKDLFKKSESSSDSSVAEGRSSSGSANSVMPFGGTGHRLFDPKEKAKVDDKLSLREKMLVAAERRQLEAQQRGNSSQSTTVQQKRPREKSSPTHSHPNQGKSFVSNVRNYFSDAESKPVTKKRKLTEDDPVIVLDSGSSSSQTTPRSLSISNSIIIDISEEAGASSAVQKVVNNEVVLLDDSPRSTHGDIEEDRVESEAQCGSPSLSPEDFRTCPVCGMSNIPKAIINAHTLFCLDAEEEALVVDDDCL